MKWSFFIGAAILATYLLLNHGAPLPGVAIGLTLAAVFNWRSRNRSPKHGRL